MNSHYLQKLEYNKILEALSSFCSTYIGKNLAMELSPCNDSNIVTKLLAETEEAVNLVYVNFVPNFYEISNIDIELKQLEINTPLSTKALLKLGTIFKLSQELKDYFCTDFLQVSDYPILSDLFNKLYSNKSIIAKIFSCIIDENTIDDCASKNLQNIRNRKRKIEQDIRAKLNDLIHSSAYSKYIQENIITIRNDRFVIPVKEEYRTQVKGFIHDISNAGSTVFIEPISVFEMNNELNKLKIEEDLEIEKILFELSKLFFPYTKELETDVNLIGKLDFIFAKAKYSKYLKATTPIVNIKKEIHLKNARHPLIIPEKVVPISLSLGETFSTLLITGPNTGGKTVTLKTVGLLTCMACSGLNIPCDEHSSIYVFDNVFADIGDDQSISNSLSTFSSHMINIVEITKKATNNSLILVDELGSGTDPLEGANLAISILDYFKSTGSLTIATTHYQELKQYALVTDGFKNASVEFDITTLNPTYKLLVGIPGKSNAFEISKKLGLNKKIISKAKSQMNSSEIDIENLLKSIYDDKSLIEKEKIEIQNELSKVKILRASLEKDNKDLQLQEQNIINNAKIKARNILLDAKEEANDIIKHINQVSDFKKLDALRNKLTNKIKDIKIESYSINSETNPINITDIKPNLEVFVTTLGQTGIVVSSHVSKSNEVQVQIGSLKTNINIKYLEKVKNSNISNNAIGKRNNSSTSYGSISKSRTAKTEINVIGMTVDEAIFVIDKFLDDCSLAKLQNARIVHGKGTGKLRDGIHRFLKNHPHVKFYRMGTFGEGEMGVTVVEIK